MNSTSTPSSPGSPNRTKSAIGSTTDTTTGTTTVITNIGSLVTNDPSLGDGSPLGLVLDAAVVIEGDRIVWTGESSKAPTTDNRVDAGWPGRHPGLRRLPLPPRLRGRPHPGVQRPYVRAAATPPGGIRTTVAATRAATDAELEANLTRYLREALRQGTTTFETKSGYGLTVEDEARALRIAAAHTDEVTYLGAHIVSPDYADDPAAYVALVTGEMLDACAPYARWVDVFCEKGAFDGDQARAILTAGRAKGLHPRVHANQLSYGPGVQLAVELDAARADHCTHLTDADVDALGERRHGRDPAARRRVLHPRPVAGRPPSPRRGRHGRALHGLQPGVVLHLLRAVLRRAGGTGHGHDPGRGGLVGHGGRRARPCAAPTSAASRPGACADLTLLDAPSHVHLAYRPGVPLVSGVWRRGVQVVGTADQRP